MSTWLVPRERLTTEQLRAVELDTQRNHVILGGPGSGKTIVLLHRADYLRHRFGTPAERYHIFVYTKVLKEYIRSALGHLDLPYDCVSTLDGWCIQYYRTNIGKKLPKNDAKGMPHFSAIRSAVLEHVSRMSRKGPLFDFVVVDEGQDLSEAAFNLLNVLSRHVTVCMDHKQRIYDVGSSEAQAASALGVRKSDLALLDTFRCSRYIVELSARFIADPREREEYFRQTRVQDVDIETPVLYYARNFEDERDQLIEIVESRMRFGKVCVLFPKRDQVYGFAEAMAEAGIEVETQDNNINFATDLPKFMTYQSAKGLTFDTVVMPRLVQKSFPHTTPELLERQLFVGITRATRWVYMSTDKNWPLPQLKRLDELMEEGLLTIKTPPGPKQRMLFGEQEEKESTVIAGKKDRKIHDEPGLLDML